MNRNVFAITAAAFVALVPSYYYISYFQITSSVPLSKVFNVLPSQADSSKCGKPVTKIVYVKTHKTSSTAVMIMLVKYWRRHSKNETKTEALPAPFVGGYPGKFRCRFKHPKNATASFHHLRFDPTEMKKCFGKGTKYVTVIREPTAAFQSGYNYYGRAMKSDKLNCFGMPLSYLLKGKDLNVNQFLMRCNASLNPTVPWYFRFQNYQSHDLGIDPALTNHTEIRRRIEEIDENMDLVMLHEYMDESLLLLKDTLCMEWEDILMSKVTPRHNSSFVFETERHEMVFQKLNKIDISLYEYFNKTLWRKVDEYGRERFDEGLKKLQALRKSVKRDVKEQDEEQETEDKELRARSEDWWQSIRHYMDKNGGACYMPRNNTYD